MAKVREPKFEEAVEELESIIAKIESGECGLEECIAEYERGVKLLGRCQSILTVVQQRIAELTAGPGGKLKIKASQEEESNASSSLAPGSPVPGAVPGGLPGAFPETLEGEVDDDEDSSGGE